MNNFIASIIIFCVSIFGMIICALFKPVYTFRWGKKVNHDTKEITYTKSFVLETFFIFPLLGAILSLCIGCIPFKVAMNGLWEFQHLNPIGIIILFFSMVYISKFLDSTGFFEFCALYAVQKSGKSGIKLYFILYAVVSILTIFTSNDVVVLTFTPFIYHFAESVGVSPIPYLFGEFFAANTWSMIFIISNPTNIVLGTAFDISFVDFFIYMLPCTLVAGIANSILLYLLFRKELQKPFVRDSKLCKPSDSIKNMGDMVVSLSILFIAVLLMAFSSLPHFPFEMWHVSGILGLLMMVYNLFIDMVRKPSPKVFLSIISKMPWSILPYLPSLFILVNCLTEEDLFGKIGRGMESITDSNPLTLLIFGVASTLAANILNNIPMSVSFVPIISSLSKTYNQHAVFASVIGSNLGANLTPLGALAGIMWLRILMEYNIKVNFLYFVKIGLIITPITLILSIGILCLIHL